MSHVFHRSANPIMATGSNGCWVSDDSGRSFLDAAGGAIVSNIGHGVWEVFGGGFKSGAVDYVHPSVFTSEPLESYGAKLSTIVPVDDLRIYPTSGGAESVETAMKMARAYQLALGNPERDLVISRDRSYHGNTLGALDISGRPPLRGPYESWLGRSVRVPAVNEYRCPAPEHPTDCAGWHARQLEEQITAVGANRVAAFVGEAIGGAATAAAMAPEGYWERVAGVCRQYGIVLIVDEIMTGFGRTGRWFGIEHSTVRPDIMVSGKGAAGGYWPFGLCMASGSIHRVIAESGGFAHGYTFSHSTMGAVVAEAVLDRLIEHDLVAAAASKGTNLMASLVTEIGEHPVVGDIRGKGLLIGIEFVADRMSKEPFPRETRFVERLTEAAREEGLLVYPSSGCADGFAGDSILLGPPFVINDDEMAMVVNRLKRAIDRVSQ